MYQNLLKYRLILIVLLFVLLGYSDSYAQGTTLGYGQKKNYLSFTVLPAQTTIFNTGVFNVSEVTSVSGYTLNGIVEFGHYFNEQFSLSTGFGYKSYATELNMNSYYNTYDSIDSENDSYEMQVSATGISETQKIGQLSIPLKVQYKMMLSRKFGAYLNTGIIFSIPIIQKYNASGLFDYEGYYPDYNITLYNLPEYGFPEKVGLDMSNKLDIADITFNVFASIGCTYQLSSSLDIAFGIYFDQSLSNVSNYQQSDFHLSRVADDYSSLMESTSEVKIRALGASLSLFYYLK